MHSGLYVTKLGLAKVRHGPPDARVDQSEHLLAGVRVGALRDGEIGYARIERRVDAAVVEVVFGGTNVAGLAFALGGERLERQDAVLRLRQLRMALLHDGLGLARIAPGQIAPGPRPRLPASAPASTACSRRGHCSSGLIHLIYGDKLLGQQRLDAMKVVGGVKQLGVGASSSALALATLALRFIDGGRGAIDIRRGAVGVRSRSSDSALLRGDRPGLVDDLPLQACPDRTAPSAARTRTDADRSRNSSSPCLTKALSCTASCVMGPSTWGAMPMKLAKTSASSVRGYRLAQVHHQEAGDQRGGNDREMLTIMPRRLRWTGVSFSGIATPF